MFGESLEGGGELRGIIELYCINVLVGSMVDFL